MDPRDRRMLEAQVRQRIPTRVEEHEHGTNVMAPSNGQELFNSLLKANGVLFPKQIVEKNAHRIHAHRFCPAHFFVDLSRVESLLLPHLELVDRGLRYVIAAHQPWLTTVPVIRLLLRPTRCLRTRRDP